MRRIHTPPRALRTRAPKNSILRLRSGASLTWVKFRPTRVLPRERQLSARGNDIIARTLGAMMQEFSGQPVVIESAAAAGGRRSICSIERSG